MSEPVQVLDEWTQAHLRNQERVRAHPRFHALVREVAIIEQPDHPGSAWARRNSPTYGAWMTRGMPRVESGISRRRARLLCELIARDLDILPSSPSREGEAVVFVTARDHVQARQR